MNQHTIIDIRLQRNRLAVVQHIFVLAAVAGFHLLHRAVGRINARLDTIDQGIVRIENPLRGRLRMADLGVKPITPSE